MGQASETNRRNFLKSSVLIGAASSSAPAFARAQEAGPPGAKLAGPTESRAQAESGPVAETSGELVANPGSDFMVGLMKTVGIDYVAAMPGSTFRGLHESVVNYGGNKSPELIVCTHEEIAAGICHGYAKVAGKPMACFVHSTVGLQHASMAIYNAWCDRVPMMVIAGNGLDESLRRPGVEWDHSAQDLATFVREYIKYDDAPVSLQHYADSFMRAYEVSLTPPYEPVLIVADSDLQEQPVHDLDQAFVPRRAPVAPPGGDPQAVATAADWLVQAKSPVIVADRAARSQEGVDLLVKLAEQLNAPVIDLAGRMNMPTPHYLNLSSQRAELIASADVILGLELTDIWGLVNTVADKQERRARRLARADARVIGVSANYGYIRSVVQDAQRYYAADLAIDADAQTCMPQLIEAVDRALTAGQRATVAAKTGGLKQRHARMRAADAQEAARGWDASPISTARLSMEIWAQIKDLDWGLVSSHGFISSWPQRLWDMTQYHHYIGAEGGYGVGYGGPASVGAALAHRDKGRIPIAIQCDGDLMCQPASLWTLAHHDIPLLMVMHNNRAWHQESMHLKRMANRRQRGPTTWNIGTTIAEPYIDYAAMARSFGVWAEGPITDPKDLPGALGRALKVVKSGKPALLDTVTQMR